MVKLLFFTNRKNNLEKSRADRFYKVELKSILTNSFNRNYYLWWLQYKILCQKIANKKH